MNYKIYGLKLKNSDEVKYIGRTSESLDVRLKKHKNNAKYTKIKNHRVCWILKYVDDIEIFIIEDNIETFEDSCHKEIYYISLYRQKCELINETNGGDGGCPGYKHTEEAKKKIGDRHRGKKISEEQREYMRNRTVTKETKKKLSDIMKVVMVGEGNPMYGRKRPDIIELNKQRTGYKMKEEVKKKMSECRTGEKNANYKTGKYTKENKLKHKRVYKLTKEDVIKMRELWETGNYKIYREIGNLFGISETYVSAVIRRVKWKNI